MKIMDIHTHGIGGYDTRTTAEGDILKIAEIHGSCGVSAIIPAIYPAALHVMRGNMEIIKKAMKLQDARYKMQDTKPAKIIGAYLEGPFLNPSRCGALNAGAFAEPAEYRLKELIEGFEDIVKIMTIAPEIKGAAGLT